MALKYTDMALKYKELKKKEEEAEFNKEELYLLQQAEIHIDKEIEKQFGKNYRDEIQIDLTIAHFRYDPTKKEVTSLSDARRTKLTNALLKMYKDAGWKIKIEYDDGLDGPNMSGPDYWILTGKRKS